MIYRKLPIVISFGDYLIAVNDYIGYCRSCGAKADNVEGDAENYPCAKCGDTEVFGIDVLIQRDELVLQRWSKTRA